MGPAPSLLQSGIGFRPFPAAVFLPLETVFTIFSFPIEVSVYPCDSDCVGILQDILFKGSGAEK